jgi:LysM domain
VDAGEGSDNQDGRGDRTPPDEQQIRLGRARIAQSGDSLGERSGLSGGWIGASPTRAPENDPGSTASGVIGGAHLASPTASPGGVEAIDLAPRFRPWSEPATANAGPMHCHFLRSVGPDGRLVDAQRVAVPTHRCAAFGDPLPLSLRQQELVCLQRVHVSCPRYVRGTLLADESPSSQVNVGSRKRLPILSIVGVGLVVLALVVVASSMLGLPPFGGGTTGLTSAYVATQPPASPSATATVATTATIQPSASPSAPPSPTLEPTASLGPTLAPTPVATPWPPGATASRMNLLVPCTGQANCYVYTVRGSGPPPGGNGSSVPDSLASIATFFGVSLNEINAMNPWASSGINAGDKLKIPPPTR